MLNLNIVMLAQWYRCQFCCLLMLRCVMMMLPGCLIIIWWIWMKWCWRDARGANFCCLLTCCAKLHLQAISWWSDDDEIWPAVPNYKQSEFVHQSHGWMMMKSSLSFIVLLWWIWYVFVSQIQPLWLSQRLLPASIGKLNFNAGQVPQNSIKVLTDLLETIPEDDLDAVVEKSRGKIFPVKWRWSAW